MSEFDETLTVRRLWAQTGDELGARHEARWLCEVAIGAFGTGFDDALGETVTQQMVRHLDALLVRYRAGEPLQYVLGRWGFRRLDVLIDPRVLIPRPETEVVAGVAIELASAMPEPRHVADLGTGSGVIGLSMADELPLDGTTVWITDVDEDALEVARANLAGLGRPARNVRIGSGSWFDALPPDVRFDVIVSNPPYVADGAEDLDRSVAEWEPAHALIGGPDGLEHIRQLIDGADEALRPGGWLVLEIGADQGDSTRALLVDGGYERIEVRPDLAGRDRIALGCRPRQ